MPATIGVLVEDRYLAHAQPRGVMAALLARGAAVTVLEGPHEATECDLVLVRGRSEALLARLAEIEAAGVPTVNRAIAIAGVVDKSVMHTNLVDAGIPVPETWIGPFDVVRARLERDRRALVAKPVRGDNGRDVVVADDGQALQSMSWHEPDVIVQRYLPNDGSDIKLYCAGDRVWTVRKRSPIHPGTAQPVLLPTTDEHRRLASSCGAATGLDLYGVDCIETDTGLVVIEVNDFPNYSGIPEADQTLAGHVLELAATMAGVA